MEVSCDVSGCTSLHHLQFVYCCMWVPSSGKRIPGLAVQGLRTHGFGWGMNYMNITFYESKGLLSMLLWQYVCSSYGRQFMSFCKVVQSVCLVICLYRIASSANSLILEEIDVGRSFM